MGQAKSLPVTIRNVGTPTDNRFLVGFLGGTTSEFSLSDDTCSGTVLDTDNTCTVVVT